MAAVKEKVELAQKHIAYQRQRIVRYRELIAELERDNKQDLLPAARELLRDLENVLARMMVEQVRTRELAKADQ
jgi:CHASE3 domain sensor protein